MNRMKGLLAGTTLHLVLAIVSVAAIIPFLLVLSASLSSERSIALSGFSLIPREWSLDAYRYILRGDSTVLDAYRVTIGVTAIGTFFGVLITTMLAYAITRKGLKYARPMSLFVYLPFLFNGGLVPFYILLLKLGFRNSLAGLIIPMLVNSFNVFLMTGFMRGLPYEIFESARMDGAGEFVIFFRIVLQLSAPALATLTLFICLGYWNDWYLSLLLIDDRARYPLQFLLRQIISNAEFARQNPKMSSMISGTPHESSKMATVIVTVGPILLAYPYLQKYFIKGITLGAVKG